MYLCVCVCLYTTCVYVRAPTYACVIPLYSCLNACIYVYISPLCVPRPIPLRFRAGFKQALGCCPCVPQGTYEGLELKSTRYLHTQTSVYKTSCMETSVSTVMQLTDEGDQRARRTGPAPATLGPPGGAMSVPGAPHGGAGGRGRGGGPRRSSLDLASNGSSSRSVSKTVSETSSFYSSHNLQD